MPGNNEPDFTYSVHTSKPSKGSKKSSAVSNDILTKPDSNSSFIMSLIPIVISIGTVALVYLLYKELKKNQKLNYDISQTVKNCQAKIVDLENQKDQASDLTEILRAANSNIIFDNKAESDKDDTDDDDREETVLSPINEDVDIVEVDIKTID